MRYVLGILRFLVILPMLLIGTVVVLVLALVPVRVRDIRLSAWPTMWMSRVFMWVFGIRVTCQDRERIEQHRGFIFPNHESYLDIVVLIYVMPMRFLSNHKVRNYPLIGWMARATETVFVNRKDRRSRANARNQIAEALVERSYPPLVLFPEGGIGVGDLLKPFHHGAFKAAAQAEIPYLPCVLHYDRFDIIPWFEKESMFSAVWRLATRKGPIHARIIPLEVIHPQPTDTVKQLVASAYDAIESTFQAVGGAVKPS